MSTTEKAALRQHFRHLRQQLNVETRMVYAKQATQLLIKQDCFRESQHIACYLSVKSEMDVMPLMEIIWQNNKKCYLPVLSHQNDLGFVHYENHDDLIPNQFGIMEPKFKDQKISLEKLDIIIMPLIAFDQKGHRLGAGGGYYDKTFANVAKDQRQPLRIGWAFSIQQAEQLPHDVWDVDLHALVTENKFLIFK